MCGITGLIAFNDKGKEKLSKISAAVYKLYKRGPDAESIYINENVTLGHRRLSIVDISSNALQPMNDSTGRFTIVFNGEIFNYKQLRIGLESKGIQFKSQSDTEVLLYLYINEKEKCLEKLDGEFAFAIYDKEENSFFLARDRFGIKPLYYVINDDNFLFASEIKALLEYGINKEIDFNSLNLYLHLNYIPSPYSIFKNVKKLEAGCYATVKENQFNSFSYYSIPYSNKYSSALTYAAAKEKLTELLEESVKNRLIADVPLGTFLSGGIDSSIITALAAKHTKNLNTFSIGYKDEPYFDETRYAQLVSKMHNTNHTVFKISNNDLFERLHNVLEYMDEPFADSSALAVNILSELTRKHVTVALSGDGADEIFAGYNKHAALLQAKEKGLLNFIIKNTGFLWDVLPKSRNSYFSNKIRQLNKLSEGLKLAETERYWRWAGFTNSNENALLNNFNNNDFNNIKSNLLSKINNDYNSFLYTDVKFVLENDMLVKADRMSMANSLEVRVPFLDHKIVDFAFSLPYNYKIDGGIRKRILKDAFKDMLPSEIFNRGKQGFEVPLLKWFQTDLKAIITNDLLNDSFIKQQGIFNPIAITKLKTQLFSNNPDDSVARIWGLIVFQHWWKKTIA